MTSSQHFLRALAIAGAIPLSLAAQDRDARVDTTLSIDRGGLVQLGIVSGEIRVTGRVVLTNVPGNLERANLPRGMAIEFLRLAPDAHAAIQSYVHERAKSYEL